ncbi:MAG: cytochrome c oxidase subunit 3 [Flavobacteriaceae bacterium]|nr:cytochrome c oxidase subunit 3 [Flavobacteriaceae bacterium]MCY4267070.1 cytochrome c oxidase subunit 3 [Flavobacteriaceae bacterium]MCY4299544.1 cytochrome c oxidase subunit 3 [Flavobacteriaceae bacterium]
MNQPISQTISIQRSKRMMLWIAMISMSMTFAGLTSAYVVSSNRPDWLTQLVMPAAFTISTIIILLSGLTFWYAKKLIQVDNISQSQWILLITFFLAIAFVYFQFQGFTQIMEQGYYFTGPESSITGSFIYVLVLLHLLHLIAGMIVVSVVMINNYRGKYNKQNLLGVELATNFWHFLDGLWLYLYLFMLLIG